MSVVPRVAAQLEAGAPLVLQRAGRSTAVGEFAAALGECLQRDVRVATEWDEVADVAVLDARSLSRDEFARWDAVRATLVPPGGQRVVLLDAVSAGALLASAPHVASWAGGVWLPEPELVGVVQTEKDMEVGRRLLREWSERHPGHAGEWVGIDLQSGRVFRRTGDASEVDAAREALDEGLVYRGRVP